MSSAKHLVIHGRVQGVCYRAWFSELAEQMSLKGWVRNRHDGTVEAMISGSSDAVERMIMAAGTGPTLAEVKEVVANERDYDGPSGFEVRPTE